MKMFAALLILAPVAFAQDEPKRDKVAKEILDAAGAVLKDAEAVSVECDSAWTGAEVKMKIKLLLKRPNLARIEFSGSGQDATIVLDGKTMWYYLKSSNQYMKSDQTAGMVESMGAGPIATIFYEKGAGSILDKVEGVSVKKEKLKEDECDVISWKLEQARYRLWVDGKKALRQYEMAVKQEDEDEGTKEWVQTVTFGVVDLAPKLADDAFAFTPPKDAKEMQRGGGDYDKSLLAVDSEAPDFEATDLEGKAVKLSDFKGKIVLVNFWFYG